MKAKKTLSALLSAAILCTAIPFNMLSATAGEEIAITEADIKLVNGYYQIRTAAGLKEFANIVNGTSSTTTQNLRANGKLMNNITFNDGSLTTFDKWETNPPTDKWTPIGNYLYKTNDNYYKGTFDGQGHTVNGIYSSGSFNGVGLFGSTQGATIKNVVTDTCYFNNTKSDYNCGTIVGYLNYNSTVSNCITKSSYINGGYSAGGIIGFADSNCEITNCKNESTTNISADSFAGGIDGYSYSNISDCENNPNINTTGYVGGIVGYSNIIISNCINNGNITSYKIAGGIVGILYEGTATNCINTGNITSTSTSDFDCSSGGIAGVIGYSNTATVSNCVSTGTVTAKSNLSNPIGVISHGSITNSYYKNDTDTEVVSGVKGVSEETFKTGEITYALNGNQSTVAFGQTLKTDDYPVLINSDKSNQVFYVGFVDLANSQAVKTVYTNSPVSVPTEFDGKVVLNAKEVPVTFPVSITADSTFIVIPSPTYTVTIPPTVDFGTLERKHENASESDKIKSELLM